MNDLSPEVRRRRTFAIISHPDAGKTTLTEKLLLFSGAIQIAGSVKARKASRHATSDWMVIEAANGVEAQTRRLIEVCRQRNTPIITFVNKMDREVREPLDILDEVERELGMPCVPMTWPVGKGKSFGGIMNLRRGAMTVFESGSERRPQDFETIPLSDAGTLRARFGSEYDHAAESMELASGASPAWDHQAFLDAKQTPVF